MKRGIFIIFFIFLLAFAVKGATVEVGQGLKDQYNLGDSITVDGKILSDVPKKDVFRLDIVCGESTSPAIVKVLDLKAGQAYLFNEKLIVPAGSQGSCHVKATFGTDTADSKTFSLTKDLKGDFELSDDEIQLGQGVVLLGRVLRMSDVNVEGIATITIKGNNETYFVDTIEVKGGSFEYGYEAKNVLGGEYSIDVYVLDLFGNEKTFVNVVNFAVVDELVLDVTFDKKEILPSETLTLTGTVKYKNGESAEEVELLVNGKPAVVSQGAFTYKLETLSAIASGKTPVVFKATDSFGNFAEGVMDFSVIPVPTRLALTTDKEEYLPQEYVEVNAWLYDQADMLIDNTASLTIKDSTGKLVQEGISGILLHLDSLAKPGIWNIKAVQDTFSIEDEFVVQELTSVSVVLQGQDVLISNTGNVQFRDTVNVSVGEGSFTEVIDLAVNESKFIQLDKHKGVKDINVFVLSQEFPLGEVNIDDRRGILDKVAGGITGNVVSSNGGSGNGWAYVLIIGILGVFIVGFYFYKKKDTGVHDLARERERKMASQYVERIRKQREKDTRSKRTFSRPIDEKAAQDFRESVLKTMEEDEKKSSGSSRDTNTRATWRERYDARKNDTSDRFNR